MTAQSHAPLAVVTGGAGFIGSNIAANLAQSGNWDVVVCDWLGDGDKWRNLAKHHFVDLIAPEDLLSYLDGNAASIDVIVHMGAISSTTERDVDLIFRNNFVFSRDLWRWASRHEKRFIYASSASTYGDGSAGFKDNQSLEALCRLQPLNPYGWSKHLFDRFIARELEKGRERPPQWAGLKFFNVYGPNEYHKGSMKSVVAQIFPNASEGKAVRLFRSHHPDYHDGGQLRDFVFVRDCVHVVDWLLEKPEVSGLFNLGTGKARSFADLAKAVFAALNQKPVIEYVDTPQEIRDRYQYFTQADMSKINLAGYRDGFTTLEDGIAHYVRDHLTQADPYL